MNKKSKSVSAAAAKTLLTKARTAQKKSHSPYSAFPVGAALLSSSGKIFTGTNIENASFGATICAERSAVSSAVSSGVKSFKAIAIVANGSKPPIPCGLCLQVLSEFCGPELEIILAPSPKLTPVKRFRLKDLLPKTFILET